MLLDNKIVYNKKFSMKKEAVEKRKRFVAGLRTLLYGGILTTIIGVSAKVNSNSINTYQNELLTETISSIDLAGDISEENVEYCINDILAEDGILPERYDKDANAMFLLGVYFDGREVLRNKLAGPEEYKAVENGFYKGVYDYLGLENDGDVHTTAPEGLESMAIGQYLLGENYSYNEKENINYYINSKDNIAKELSSKELEDTSNKAHNVLEEYVASQKVNVSNYSDKKTANSVNDAFKDKEDEIANMVNEANEANEFEAVLEDGTVLTGHTNKR